MKDLDSNRTNELFSKDELLAHSGRRTSKKKRGHYCTEGNLEVLVRPPFKTYERMTS
jgi:hypothetical protein